MEDLDNYYAEFLKTREAKAIIPKDSRSDGVRIGEQYIDKLERALEGKYYVKPVLDYLYARLSQEYKNPKWSHEESFRRFIKKSTPTETNVFEAVIKKDFFDTTDMEFLLFYLSPTTTPLNGQQIPELKKSRYKMLDIVAGVEHSESVKRLSKELTASVGQRFPGWHLVWDEEKKEYKFAPPDVKPEQNKAQKPEAEFEFALSKFRYRIFELPDKIVKVFNSKNGTFLLMHFNLHPDDTNTANIHLADLANNKIIPLGLDSAEADTFIMTDQGYAYVQYENGKSILRLPKESFTFDAIYTPILHSGNVIVFGTNEGLYEYNLEFGDHRRSTMDYKYLATNGFIKDTREFSQSLEDLLGINSITQHEFIETDSELIYIDYFVINGKRSVIKKEKSSDGSLSKLPGLVLSPEYDDIKLLTKVGNGYAYAAISDEFWYVYVNDKKLPWKLENVIKIISVNGKVYFTGINTFGEHVLCSEKSLLKHFWPAKNLDLQADENGIIVLVEEKNKQILYTYNLDGSQREKNKIGETNLNYDEKRKLRLLNAIVSYDKNKVSDYMAVHMQFNDSTPKREIQTSRSFIGAVNEALKGGKKALLDTIAAKREGKREVQMLAEYLYPELFYGRQRQGRKKTGQPRPGDYLSSLSQSHFLDSDPTAETHEVLRTRERIPEMIVSGLYGNYDKATGSFESASIPILPELNEPVREHTFTLPAIHGLAEINLPFLLNAEIIPERVRGIRADGSEIPLTIDKLPTGGARITVPADIQSIVYSLRRSELPVIPTQLSVPGYEQFLRKTERRFGKQLSEKIVPLPSELKLFVQSIEKLSPPEKLIAIEKEVRRIGYYDFKNGEVQPEKHDMKLDELFTFMQERMAGLKQRTPELAQELTGKLYAGVCADFNKLVLAMMRDAGLAGGLVTGFRPASEIVTTGDAHGTAFAIWPSDKDDYFKIIQIDGTPGGVTTAEQELLKYIQRPALEEQIKIYKEKTEKFLAEATARMIEVEELIANNDVERIRSLSNGELENIVNTILRYGVKESHFAVIRSILDASQYSQLNLRQLNLADSAQVETFKNFVTSEIERERTQTGASVAPAGNELYTLIERYIQRNGSESYAQLEQIFDLIRPQLGDIEARAFMATVKYLEAKRITK